jgi:hypothetical protein
VRSLRGRSPSGLSAAARRSKQRIGKAAVEVGDHVAWVTDEVKVTTNNFERRHGPCGTIK